jgi:hypothetical protein
MVYSILQPVMEISFKRASPEKADIRTRAIEGYLRFFRFSLANMVNSTLLYVFRQEFRQECLYHQKSAENKKNKFFP